MISSLSPVTPEYAATTDAAHSASPRLFPAPPHHCSLLSNENHLKVQNAFQKPTSSAEISSLSATDLSFPKPVDHSSHHYNLLPHPLPPVSEPLFQNAPYRVPPPLPHHPLYPSVVHPLLSTDSVSTFTPPPPAPLTSQQDIQNLLHQQMQFLLPFTRASISAQYHQGASYSTSSTSGAPFSNPAVIQRLVQVQSPLEATSPTLLSPSAKPKQQQQQQHNNNQHTNPTQHRQSGLENRRPSHQHLRGGGDENEIVNPYYNKTMGDLHSANSSGEVPSGCAISNHANPLPPSSSASSNRKRGRSQDKLEGRKKTKQIATELPAANAGKSSQQVDQRLTTGANNVASLARF